MAEEKIAVVYGGTSTERQESEENAQRIGKTLEQLHHKAEMTVYDENIVEKLKALRPECVFLCVQGKYHGDGTLQAICSHLGIPYTGSKTEAAAIINDKKICKELCAFHGIRTPEYRSLKRKAFEKMSRAELTEYLKPVGYPLVAKGVTQGGSYGIRLIKSDRELAEVGALYDYDDELMFEQFIEGRFVTVPLLKRGGQMGALTIVEGISKEQSDIILFNQAFMVKKAELSESLEKELVASALAVSDICGAESYARVDYMLDESGTPYFLEINAVPGMREESFYPIAAEMSGISFENLVEIILENR